MEFCRFKSFYICVAASFWHRAPLLFLSNPQTIREHLRNCLTGKEGGSRLVRAQRARALHATDTSINSAAARDRHALRNARRQRRKAPNMQADENQMTPTTRSYYVYEPIPDRIEERWKLMLTNSFFRTLSHLADLCESAGLKDYMDVMYVITLLEKIVPVSDEHVKVTEEMFDGVEVVLYQPKLQGGDAGLRRAVIYLHGGGWCLGSSRMSPYDLLARKLVTELDAVVLSVEYRLAPAHHFPVPYEDVHRVVKYFLQKGVLAQYSVDPGRVAVSGDSAGGNLAAAVSQQLQKESGQQIKLRAQALLYPVLQALDLKTPSYQQNKDMPILPRTLMVRFWSEYFTSNKALFRAMMSNSHNSPESSRLLKFVNWSAFLPEAYHKDYNYSAPSVTQGTEGEAAGMDGPSQSFADPRASPLLVPDADLHSLPKAYILTCEYDVLRDDGIMYATRLRAAGVEVTHQHYDTGFHGALMFTVWPTDFLIARRMTDNYVKWLKVNL